MKIYFKQNLITPKILSLQMNESLGALLSNKPLPKSLQKTMDGILEKSLNISVLKSYASGVPLIMKYNPRTRMIKVKPIPLEKYLK